MAKLWIIIAGLFGAGAVALGAFHEHGLKEYLEGRFAPESGEIDAEDPKFREKFDKDESGVMEAAEIEAYIADQRDDANTAVKYMMYHTLAIVAVGILLTRNRGFCWFLLNTAALLFLLGIVGFSGGICLVVFDVSRALHWIIPIGGLLMIIGWVVLALAGIFVAIERREDNR